MEIRERTPDLGTRAAAPLGRRTAAAKPQKAAEGVLLPPPEVKVRPAVVEELPALLAAAVAELAEVAGQEDAEEP